jgi:hypothetical protein
VDFSFSREKLAPALLAAALLVSLPRPAFSQQPKKHQATGIIVSANATRIILLRQFGRNKVPWTFVLAPHSAAPADLTKGARARIYYHDEKGQHLADRWKLIAPPTPVSAPPKSASPAPAPASAAPKPAPAAPAPEAPTANPKPPS